MSLQAKTQLEEFKRMVASSLKEELRIKASNKTYLQAIMEEFNLLTSPTTTNITTPSSFLNQDRTQFQVILKACPAA